MRPPLIALKKGCNSVSLKTTPACLILASGNEGKKHRSYYTSARLSRLRGGRPYSSEASTAVASPDDDGVEILWRGPPALSGLAQQKIADRGLFLDVLNSTASKREARSYLSRFNRPKEKAGMKSNRRDAPHVRTGVNLGGLFLPPRAVDQHPKFSQTAASETLSGITSEPLHIALVKINIPDTIKDTMLSGIGLTLTQLSRLGMTPVVVVDHPSEATLTDHHRNSSEWRKRALREADRVVDAIEHHSSQGARRLDTIIGISSDIDGRGASVAVQGQATVLEPNLLFAPIRRGVIPVLTAIGYTPNQSIARVSASEVVLALTRELAGLTNTSAEDDVQALTEKITSTQRALSLDRIIILDPKGGIPSIEKFGGSHVFINLEQEYSSIGLTTPLR